MEKKVILITGATSGIGKAVAKGLAIEPGNSHLFLLARNTEKSEALKDEIQKLNKNIEISLLVGDLSLQSEIRKLSQIFKEQSQSLDVLINCAGVVSSKRIETKEGIENTWAVNYLSHFLLSNLLLEELNRSRQGRIINVSSLIPAFAKIDFTDINSIKKYSPVESYFQAKVADVMFTYGLAQRLRNTTNITVNAIHPGIVKTNLGAETTNGILKLFSQFCDNFIAITPEKSAERILYLATSTEVKNISGKYFHSSKEPVTTNSFSCNKDNIQKLWILSEEMVSKTGTHFFSTSSNLINSQLKNKG